MVAYILTLPLDRLGVLSDYAEHISKVLVQFAGQLAQADIQPDKGIGASGEVLENAAEGVVTHDETAQTLTVNLDAAIWDEIAAGVQPQTHIIESLYTDTGRWNVIRDVTESQWGDDTINAIDRVVFATVDNAVTVLTDNPAAVPDKGTFFVGGEGVVQFDRYMPCTANDNVAVCDYIQKVA